MSFPQFAGANQRGLQMPKGKKNKPKGHVEIQAITTPPEKTEPAATVIEPAKTEPAPVATEPATAPKWKTPAEYEAGPIARPGRISTETATAIKADIDAGKLSLLDIAWKFDKSIKAVEKIKTGEPAAKKTAATTNAGASGKEKEEDDGDGFNIRAQVRKIIQDELQAVLKTEIQKALKIAFK